MSLLGQKDCKLFSFDNCVRNRGMKNVLCTKRAKENNKKRRCSLSWKGGGKERLKIQRNEHTRLSRKREGEGEKIAYVDIPSQRKRERGGGASFSLSSSSFSSSYIGEAKAASADDDAASRLSSQQKPR